MRKLGSYPRQNGLAVALRELGRIERTLFILNWLQSVELRRRVNAGLNEGEARNALARAVFFNRLGEIRDRSFEQQRHRASGLTLVTAAIVLWNTMYLERAVRAIRQHNPSLDEALCKHLSPLGWEHINLTFPPLRLHLDGKLPRRLARRGRVDFRLPERRGRVGGHGVADLEERTLLAAAARVEDDDFHRDDPLHFHSVISSGSSPVCSMRSLNSRSTYSKWLMRSAARIPTRGLRGAAARMACWTRW